MAYTLRHMVEAERRPKNAGTVRRESGAVLLTPDMPINSKIMLQTLRHAKWGVLAVVLFVLGTWTAQAAPLQATRGVSAHAASDAAVGQLRPLPTDVPTEAPAPASVSEASAAPAFSKDRSVLFKVTPPALAEIPAQLAQEAQAPMPVRAPVAPSYLLGTIHFGTPEEQGLDYARLDALVDGAQTFVNEADIDTPWQSSYDSYRWLPPESPLGDMIGKDALGLAHALLPKIAVADLQRMKPWAVLALLEARGESGGDATLDAHLQKSASSAGKRMVHLETLEQQLQALNCVVDAQQARVLKERLHKSWVLRIESAEAMAFYRTGNLDAWLDAIDRMDGLSDSAKEIEHQSRVCLLEDRNARWIGPLETLMQEGGGFVAVGAVHLVGPDGLIARLRKDGFNVEAVQP